MKSQQIVGIALLVAGGLLLFFGWQSSQSMGEQLVETVTGRFTDATMWYFIGGCCWNMSDGHQKVRARAG